jgi:hypothetical protein
MTLSNLAEVFSYPMSEPVASRGGFFVPGGSYVSGSTLFLLVCPFLALVLVCGVVAVVALCQANPEDVPAVVRELAPVFRRLGHFLPAARRRHHLDRRNLDEETDRDKLHREEA